MKYQKYYDQGYFVVPCEKCGVELHPLGGKTKCDYCASLTKEELGDSNRSKAKVDDD